MLDGKSWWKSIAVAAVLAIIYFLIFIWFRMFDVWDINKDPSTIKMLSWVVLRIVFLGIMCIICITIGKVALIGFSKDSADLTVTEKMLLNFFIGGALLRIIMYFIGICGLYKGIFVFCFTFPALILFPFVYDVKEVYCDCIDGLTKNPLENIIYAGIWFIAILILSIIYVAHCQYSFDGDYLTHYGPYYNAVIQSGSLAPNEWWYQYFYSKGAGLFYYSMLITDRSGPLLVSFLHLIAVSLLIYAIVSRVSGNRLWGISAAIFILGMMAWPIDGFYIKHHCETGSLIFATSVATVLFYVSPRHRNISFATVCILQSSLVLYSLQASIYTAVFVCIFGMLSIRNHDYISALRYFVAIIITATVSLGSLLYNFWLTGLYEITPFRVFLRFWNQKVFSKWVSPYLMLYLSEGSSPDLGSLGFAGKSQNIFMYARLFRLEKFVLSPSFWFILIGVIAAYVIHKNSSWIISQATKGFFGFFVSDQPPIDVKLYTSTKESHYNFYGYRLFATQEDSQYSAFRRLSIIYYLLFPAITMCLLVFVVYLTVNQPVSIIRMSEFVSIFVTITVISFIMLVVFSISNPIFCRAISVLVPIAISLSMCSMVLTNGHNGKIRIPLKFAFGLSSLAEVSPSQTICLTQMKELKRIAGPGSRIVSLNLDTDYGVLFLEYPGIITEVSYSFGNSWHQIVFGAPDIAKQTLQQQEINYFLVNLQSPFFGSLPFSPLFSGDSLVKNFRVLWRSKDTFLLTWNNAPSSIDNDFCNLWNNAMTIAMPTVMDGKQDYGKQLYERIYFLYKYNSGTTSTITRPTFLGRVQGWQ